jgi:hypothetical protein
MSTETLALCWCGRPPEEHDGRELSAQNELHLFNRPVHEPEELRDFDDTRQSGLPDKARALRLPLHVVALLISIRKFLDGEIVAQAHNGMKIPLGIVNKASALSASVSRELE